VRIYLKAPKHINFDSVFDLDKSPEEYTEDLRSLLKENRVSIVERRKIIRQKTQEFKDKLRTKNRSKI
jgi:hypothetical protein